MAMSPKLLDVVAILKSIAPDQLILVEPEYESIELPIGLVGSIVEIYKNEEPHDYLIEFSDDQGNEYAMAVLPADDFVVLRYQLDESSKDLVSA